MRPTSGRSIKALTSAFHIQRPLTPRESQQLLLLLNSSFRQHLEGVSSTPRSRSKEADEPATSASEAVFSPPTPIAQSSRSLSAAHLTSILNNPLLSVKPNTIQAQSTYTSKTFGEVRLASAPKAALPRPDPVHVFKERVASGLATLHDAEQCLKRVYQGAVQSHHKSNEFTARLSNSHAGSTVAEWIDVNDLTSHLDFWKASRSFHKCLSLLLASEGRHDILWQWLEKDTPNLRVSAPIEVGTLAAAKHQFLYEMVRYDLKHNNTSDAIQKFNRAASSVQDGSMDLFGSFGLILSKITSRTVNAPIATQAYDRFVTDLPTWNYFPDFYAALLRFYRPQQTDAEPGLAYLNRSAELEKAYANSAFRVRMLQFSLDLAKYLLEHGRNRDGAWILEFAQLKFPRELGIQQNQQEPRKRERSTERQSIEMLNGLALG